MCESVASRLIQWMSAHRSITVAFSGGVDSTVVAAAATRSSADEVLAVTAVSPSVPDWQRDIAVRVAGELGVQHRFLRTDEVSLPDYQRNDNRRCFHCKSTLYARLGEAIGDGNHDGGVVVSGTNADDLGDFRPGIEAGRRAGVRTPLADLGITKTLVRQLARHWEISNHDLPASPCLASRIAFHVPVTPDRLAMVEKAESWFREHGFSDVRVRVHESDLARVEVPLPEVTRLAGTELAETMVGRLREIGFRFVTLDPAGLQSGSLHRGLVSIGTQA